MKVKGFGFLSILLCALGVAVVAHAGRVSIKPPAPKMGSATAASPKPVQLIGNIAPEFTLETVAGGTGSLSEHRGKYVLVDFWGTWCMPCIKSIPELVEAYEKIDKNKFEFISICQNCSDLEDFVDENDMIWPQLISESSVIRDYAVRIYPTMFVIDPQGKVITDNHTDKALHGDLLPTLESLSGNLSAQ